MTQNNRRLGSCFEQKVAAFLENNGFLILEHNYRCRSGEIDLIAKDGNYLVFVEVKYRKTAAAGSALEAVDKRKAAQVRKVAAYYLYQKHLPESTPCRFDAAAVDGERLTYVKDAF